jgi:hypothetical protein
VAIAKKIVNVKFPTMTLATPWETSGMESSVRRLALRAGCEYGEYREIKELPNELPLS